jgi:hypothetical protein
MFAQFKKIVGFFVSALWLIPKGLYWICWLPYQILKWIAGLLKKGGRKIFWENYGEYIRGTVGVDEHGKVTSIKFIDYSDIVHYHYTVSGCLILGVLQYFQVISPAFAAPFLVLLPMFSTMIVIWEFPADKLLKPVLAIVVGLPLADFGLYKLTELASQSISPWLATNWPSLGVTAESARGYELLWGIEKLLNYFALAASPGLAFFNAFMWGVFIFFSAFVGSVLFRRRELTPDLLISKQTLKSEDKEPVYMRGVKVVIKDAFESFPFGFATLTVRLSNSGSVLVLRNIPGLAFDWWLGSAFDQLIRHNSGKTVATKGTMNQPEADDPGALVKPHDHDKDHEEEVNKDVEHHAEGDIAVAQERSHDLAGLDDHLDAEEDLR